VTVIDQWVPYARLIATERGFWDWSFDTGALADLAAIVGLFFVVIQLRDVKRQLVLANLDPTAQRMLDADLQLVQHPELREFIYGQVDGIPVDLPENPNDRAAALALAEYFVDMLDTEMLRRSTFRIVSKKLPDFEPWLCDLLMQSVAACHVIVANHEWYSEGLLARFAELADRRMSAVIPSEVERARWRNQDHLSPRWRAAVERRSERVRALEHGGT
jgi:hypothetical protein